MKTITIQEAFDLISKSSAIIVDDNALMYPSLDELTGSPENEWLYLSWEDGDGMKFETKFIEEETEILFDGTSIYMKDYEDEDSKLTLLDVWNDISKS